MIVRPQENIPLPMDADKKELNAKVDSTVKMQEADYYIDGSFGGLKWNESFYNPDYKFTESNGVYILNNIELKVGDEIVIQSFTKGATGRIGK